MKNLMILLFSFICLSASIAGANASERPVCPSLNHVKGVNFEEAMYFDSEYGYVAYYDDLLPLGTPSLWYEAEVNLTPQPESGVSETDQILKDARAHLQDIDTQVNERAEIDALFGIQLYVCYYKSSNPDVKARLITATPLENGYLFNANTPNIAAGLAQLAR